MPSLAPPVDPASGSAVESVPTGPSDPNVVFSSPEVAAQVDSLIESIGCARSNRGRSISRGTCTNDWYHDLDLSFSQELPGPGRFFGREDKIRAFVMVDR